MHVNQPIIILGMHRSGTSIVTRLLGSKGVNFGRFRDDNDESKFFQRYNDYFLQICSSHWDNVRHLEYLSHSPEFKDRLVNFLSEMSLAKLKFFHGSLQCWGFKDPRTLLFLDIWLTQFPNAKVIYIKRNGIDVAKSLYLRSKLAMQERGIVSKKRSWIDPFIPSRSRQAVSVYCSTLERSFDLWVEYQKIAEHKLHDRECYTLCYEDLVEDENVLRGLLNYLDMSFTTDELSNLFSMLNKNTKSYNYTDPQVTELKINKQVELKKYGY